VGRWYGDASVWATIVSVLAAFDIAKGKDAAGNEIGIDPDNYGGGLVRYVRDEWPKNDADDNDIIVTLSPSHAQSLLARKQRRIWCRLLSKIRTFEDFISVLYIDFHSIYTCGIQWVKLPAFQIRSPM
jgi:hypothetical protein